MRAGTKLYIQVQVYDFLQKPPQLFNPTQGVKLTLFKPDGTVALNAVTMTNLATGTFAYQHQTQASDAKGFWATEFVASDAGGVGRTKSGGFTLT